MSGGAYNYEPSRMCEELFGYSMNLSYGEEGWKQSTKARQINPLGNREISEMLWDLLCLLHSKEWYQSGDTCEETYQKDLDHFKSKWGRKSKKDILKEYKNDLKQFYEELVLEMNSDYIHTKSELKETLIEQMKSYLTDNSSYDFGMDKQAVKLCLEALESL